MPTKIIQKDLKKQANNYIWELNYCNQLLTELLKLIQDNSISSTVEDNAQLKTSQTSLMKKITTMQETIEGELARAQSGAFYPKELIAPTGGFENEQAQKKADSQVKLQNSAIEKELSDSIGKQRNCLIEIRNDTINFAQAVASTPTSKQSNISGWRAAVSTLIEKVSSLFSNLPSAISNFSFFAKKGTHSEVPMATQQSNKRTPSSASQLTDFFKQKLDSTPVFVHSGSSYITVNYDNDKAPVITGPTSK